MTKYQE